MTPFVAFIAGVVLTAMQLLMLASAVLLIIGLARAPELSPRDMISGAIFAVCLIGLGTARP